MTSPDDIRFLRTETMRVARDQLTAHHVPRMKIALVETLAALERYMADSAGLPCDVPEETIDVLINRFEFLPGRLAPPVRRKKRKPKGRQ